MNPSTTTTILVSVSIICVTVLIALGHLAPEHIAPMVTLVLGWLIPSPKRGDGA